MTFEAIMNAEMDHLRYIHQHGVLLVHTVSATFIRGFKTIPNLHYTSLGRRRIASVPTHLAHVARPKPESNVGLRLVCNQHDSIELSLASGCSEARPLVAVMRLLLPNQASLHQLRSNRPSYPRS